MPTLSHEYTGEADFVGANPFGDVIDNLLWRSDRHPIEEIQLPAA